MPLAAISKGFGNGASDGWMGRWGVPQGVVASVSESPLLPMSEWSCTPTSVTPWLGSSHYFLCPLQIRLRTGSGCLLRWHPKLENWASYKTFIGGSLSNPPSNAWPLQKRHCFPLLGSPHLETLRGFNIF